MNIEAGKGFSKDDGSSSESHSLPPPPPPPPAPAAPQIIQVNAILTPPEVYNAMMAVGEAKMQNSYFKLAVMGLLAGFYVSFGFSFCAASIGMFSATWGTAATMTGALSFPTGLLLIILCGAELYTGNTCYMFIANIEGKAGAWAHIKIISSAYFWNLVGSLIVVGLELGGDVWLGREDYVHNIAKKKVALTKAAIICRGILANWLVNLAVYQAFSARDVVGKAIGCWTPIACFVAIGFEHCIANMWVIPMSIYLAPTAAMPVNITWAQFIRDNLIWSTIGNWIGGAIMVGAFYACCYGKNIPRWKDQVWDATLGKVIPKLP